MPLSSPSRKIRVMVVDDSAFMRKILRDIINSDPELEVCCEARDGIEAISLAKLHRPDVVTLDIEMPKMNGLDALRVIMKQAPLPVIMVSALTQEGAEATIKALEYGAIDFIPKPSSSISINMKEMREEIIAKIKEAARVPRRFLELRRTRLLRAQKIKTRKPSVPAKTVVTIASSTGGPQSLLRVFPKFPENLKAAVLLVQHMPPGFTRSFAKRLDSLSRIDVKEAEDGDPIEEGKAYVAPGDYHMEVQMRAGKPVITLNKKPKIHGVRPAADPMMITAAEVFGRRTVGIVMTGMGKDGAQGIVAIKKKGGITIAQDRETSIIFGMPKAAIETGMVDHVVPLDKIAETMVMAVNKVNRGGAGGRSFAVSR
ncbi:protein-glutamate methylesterase/protein-glutamine glutaminase [Thermococcus aciditolerans]|uniref:Protein-glutamate methylesterase/protein-glutamine glutaminase n=1 Tax=Thermococcus aciditolerans TaxID=2598455 RepID=A0A5C0SMI1_9EURY|nr:chemotaxis response regulator protein-glutamate methylesterase [Thermococcus aciditolerans]QEK15603.1 chemotaxis response regulator protein-glutamate methylesterase [Thermococcus aciditolerans]